ncbi:hypothetical protein LguiB_025878 [Lonicera macranthoides]
MASVQVLPPSGASSRKKEHLEAGKRRLEEFRKKKAADRAKKATSSIQLHEKQPSEAEDVRLTDSDGAGTSDGAGAAFSEPSNGVINNDIKANEFLHNTDLGSSHETHGDRPFSINSYYMYSADKVQTNEKDVGFQGYDLSSGPVNVNSQEIGNNDNFGINFGTLGRLADQTATEQPSAFQQSFKNVNSPEIGNNDNFGINLGILGKLADRTAAEQTSAFQQSYKDINTSSSYEDSVHRTSKIKNSSSEVQKNINSVFNYNKPLVPENGERTVSSFVGHLTSASSPSPWSTESRSSGFSSDGNNNKRTRPSFLDSIHTSRVSSESLLITEPEKADSFSSKAGPIDILASSASQNSMNSQVAAGKGDDLFRHGINEHNTERNHIFQSPKVDEDFAALEQHIEDLTQEKFSLQRALEASRTLADSLAAENSALTDSYNQQGSAVQQIKLDMEKLQEEIKAQLVELESVKMGYTNAQMECNAADERAKLLASEVIGLEEKALRLRSSELKLERQLENLQAEVSSSKKKISSLEKERQDLQLTIADMQEEKKMLQSMLRKASASGKTVVVSKSPNNKKNASTSTEDLDLAEDERNSTPETSNLEMHSTSLHNGIEGSSYLLQPENTDFRIESPLNIPPDHLRTIQNINTLISELSLEKEELMQALSSESSQSSRLKELNKELSRKLELQTQRLELLTAQNMVNDNVPPRQPDSHADSRDVNDSIAYADEGDEVVERVLGWIMKLFPGGPSRRRTSKLI